MNAGSSLLIRWVTGMLGLAVSAILLLISTLLLYGLSAGSNPGVGIRDALLLNVAYIACSIAFLTCVAVSVARLAGSKRLPVIAGAFAIGSAFAGVFITVALVAIDTFDIQLNLVENGWRRAGALILPSLLVSLFIGITSGLLLLGRKTVKQTDH